VIFVQLAYSSLPWPAVADVMEVSRPMVQLMSTSKVYWSCENGEGKVH
jgi:hypothetical protein